MKKKLKKEEETFPKGKLVMYRAFDGHEVLVCSPIDEEYLLDQWFHEADRKTSDYYRCTFKGILTIETRMTAVPELIIEES